MGVGARAIDRPPALRGGISMEARDVGEIRDEAWSLLRSDEIGST